MALFHKLSYCLISQFRTNRFLFCSQILAFQSLSALQRKWINSDLRKGSKFLMAICREYFSWPFLWQKKVVVFVIQQASHQQMTFQVKQGISAGCIIYSYSLTQMEVKLIASKPGGNCCTPAGCASKQSISFRQN